MSNFGIQLVMWVDLKSLAISVRTDGILSLHMHVDVVTTGRRFQWPEFQTVAVSSHH